ncbi:hypothetical protein MOQ72_38420 [Saccharopolyspora sp. K220]|nr:hypothetical protein [Saccharopolyspora soli]MCI2423311.1 hypothetical protein [Saccharopolyspora soli]
MIDEVGKSCWLVDQAGGHVEIALNLIEVEITWGCREKAGNRWLDYEPSCDHVLGR